MNLSDWLTEHPLDADVEPADTNPNVDPVEDAFPGASHWLVTLHNAAGALPVPFSQGSAHTAPPTVEDVLDCLASDATSFENARSFEDWCADYGYDTDSRRALATFEAVERQSTALRALLGDQAYDGLVWEVERL